MRNRSSPDMPTLAKFQMKEGSETASPGEKSMPFQRFVNRKPTLWISGLALGLGLGLTIGVRVEQNIALQVCMQRAVTDQAVMTILLTSADGLREAIHDKAPPSIAADILNDGRQKILSPAPYWSNRPWWKIVLFGPDPKLYAALVVDVRRVEGTHP